MRLITKCDIFESTSTFEFCFLTTRIVVGWTHDVSLLPGGSCMKDDQRIWQSSPAQFTSFGETLSVFCFQLFDSCQFFAVVFPLCMSSLTMGLKYWALEHVVTTHVCNHAQGRSLDDSKCLPAKKPKNIEGHPKHAQKMPRLFLLIPIEFVFRRACLAQLIAWLGQGSAKPFRSRSDYNIWRFLDCKNNNTCALWEVRQT